MTPDEIKQHINGQRIIYWLVYCFGVLSATFLISAAIIGSVLGIALHGFVVYWCLSRVNQAQWNINYLNEELDKWIKDNEK